MLIEAGAWSILWGFAAAMGVHTLVPFWGAAVHAHLASRGARLKSLGFSPDALNWWLLAWAAATVSVTIALAAPLGMWPIAIAVAVVMLQAPAWFIDEMIRRHENKLRDQLAPACFGLACGVRAGLTLPVALERAANDAPQPMRGELTEIVEHYRRGVPLRAAIEQVRTRLGLELFSLVAMAINVAIERGGNLSTALERIAITVRETQRLEGRLQVLTAAPRKAVVTLAIFPVVFLGLVLCIDFTAVISLFNTFHGQLAVCASVAIVLVSFRWARHISRSVI